MNKRLENLIQRMDRLAFVVADVPDTLVTIQDTKLHLPLTEEAVQFASRCFKGEV